MEQNSEYQKSSSTLEHHLNAVKQEDYSSTFNKTSDWIYKAGIQMENQKHLNERKINKMKSFFLAHKLRLVYTVIVFAVIVGACNMPVTQTETAGTIISLTVPAENTDFASKLNSLDWIRSAQVSYNENTDNGVKQTFYNIMLPNANEEQAKQYAKQIEALGEITTIRIKPINYDIKRPLYSAALHDFFSVDINASGMSDDELKKEMETKLKEQGVDMKFSVTTSPEGRREIKVQNEGKIDANKEPKSFEMNIEDNNGQEKIKMMTKKADPKRFEGKTDKEIRDMVRNELGNPELKDNEIIITRDGGKVQVKVEVNKDIKK
jgi:hypothetical protein